MGMKIIKTRTTAVLFGLIFMLLSCKNEQVANTEMSSDNYFYRQRQLFLPVEVA
jgi:hypothetical protein